MGDQNKRVFRANIAGRELLLADDATGPERQWVERINAAARRLAKTVQRMFKLVENKEFGQTLDLEPVELEPLVREAIEELTPYLEAREQRVEVEIEPQFGSIDADSSKIMDILINLLANAIKFTPDRGTI